MSQQLPEGSDLRATLKSIHALASNIIHGNNSAPHLVTARLLFKGMMLAYIADQIRVASQDNPHAPGNTLEAFADHVLSTVYLTNSAEVSPRLSDWTCSVATGTNTASPLRLLAAMHLDPLSQDAGQIRMALMTLLDGLSQHVSSAYGRPLGAQSDDEGEAMLIRTSTEALSTFPLTCDEEAFPD